MGAIRKLQPSDAGQVVEHLLRLDATDRRLRFCAMVGDTFIRDYVAKLDWSRALLFGVVEDHTLRGLGELLLYPGDPPAGAEAAFSVERAWRNQGLCHCLMDRVLAAGRVLKVPSVHMYMLGENDPMRHVAGNTGFAYHREDGEIHAVRDQVEAEASPTEIGPTEIGPTEIGPTEIGPTEIVPAESAAVADSPVATAPRDSAAEAVGEPSE